MSDKLPWFPMYPADFVTSRKVGRMRAEQVGIYTLLLCEQWMGGPLPDDGSELARIGKASETKVRAVIDLCFDLTAKGWVNKRLEEVHNKQKKMSATRKRAATAAAKARWEKERAAGRMRDASQAYSETHGNKAEQNKAEQSKKETTTDSDDGFEDFWEIYPKRSGGNPKKEAHSRWRSAVKRGVLPVDILKGVARYRSFCIATQKVGTEFVLQAKTFLGEKNEGWKQNWAITESLTSGSINENDHDAQRREEARARNSKHEVETYEADEQKAKDQHVEMKEFFDDLPAAEQTRLKHEISHRALAIWPNGEPPAAVYRGCFAAVVSEQMEMGGAA